MMWYLLEASRASNEYHIICFRGEIRKHQQFLVKINLRHHTPVVGAGSGALIPYFWQVYLNSAYGLKSYDKNVLLIISH